ncbi:MAG TPA: NAD+ synthase [Bacteroidia bacterium]|nr:NAD+ synthase [Bacteroidota bacterium]HRC32740.1 NAD+ synthase [Bacteroidia bacterium]
MKIALAQLNYHIANFESNTKKIIDVIKNCKRDGCDLVVFSEMNVCGYPALDFLEFDDFISRCLDSVQHIAEHCVGIAAIVGGPSRNPILDGKNLFNSAFFVADGEVQHTVHKALLPTYDVFDEYRYFEPAKEFKCFDYKGFKLAITVCEDLWNLEDDPLYTYCPMDELTKEQPHLMINIAASPFNYMHAETRQQILRKNVTKYGVPLIYVNQVGANTDLIFDGGSLVMDSSGKNILKTQYFEEDIKYIVCEKNEASISLQPTHPQSEIALNVFNTEAVQIERIHSSLILGIRDYFAKMGFSKAVFGMSGGIDSALVYYLSVMALGKENILPVMMPSQFSSDGSVSDSQMMINRLGTKSHIIPIKEIFEHYEKTLQPIFNNAPFNVAEENIQARIRGTLLMAISNKQGYILLNTSNKSELAVGYGTLYGDMCGGLAVLGDLYKTKIYELAKYINRNEEIIPNNIIYKAPSAELRPNQKDSDSLPEYDVLDAVLMQYIENRKSIQEIIAMGFDEALVSRILRMVNNNEYKRYQFAPVLRVSPHAFGLGRRMPLVAKYLG